MNHNSWKSTRLKITLAALLLTTLVWLVGPIGPFVATMSTDQWTTFVQWVFGLYAASEVGRYGTEAYGNKVHIG